MGLYSHPAAIHARSVRLMVDKLVAGSQGRMRARVGGHLSYFDFMTLSRHKGVASIASSLAAARRERTAASLCPALTSSPDRKPPALSLGTGTGKPDESAACQTLQEGNAHPAEHCTSIQYSP
ncbi:hypothetical protein CPT_Paku_002 [Burkholderia phage Paku]|uniref:Uncharacterized protein n=1 Tax=Burkholderia phage Paku TaxID=2859650 RepID=A0AAE7WMM7_9CAUD|nr:hypothetical protein CPT_Paku_002 [Burkholderia phage Paku]